MKRIFCSAALIAAVPLFGAAPVEFGVAPSHIAAPTNPLFESPESWRPVWQQAKILKVYDVQFTGAKWARQVDPAALTRFMQTSGLKLGMEFANGFGRYGNQDYGRQVAQDCLRNMAPIFAAGGRVDSLHLDGSIARTIGNLASAPNAAWRKSSLSIEDTAKEIAIMFEEIQNVHPDLEIGLVPNLMNWDWSPEAPGALGGWTRDSGLYYRDALELIHRAVEARGRKIAFIEIDAPYNYYQLNRSPRTGRSISGKKLISEVEKWCRERKIRFHLVVNCEPKAPFGDYPENAKKSELESGAKLFRAGVLDYVEALAGDGIRPDLIMFQSWYRAPAENLPVDAKYSFTGIVRDAMELAARKLNR
jgi:hypothetical protein